MRTGVILLNLGGPDSLQAIKPFLYNLFSDRQIIRLGPAFMQRPLAWLISTLRAKKTMEAYSLIGGKSPILDITNAQAAALEHRLGEHGDFSVRVGMRYWHPFIKDVVKEMCNSGIKRILSVSLYPHYSLATTGSSEASFKEAVKGFSVEFSSVSSWFDHPLYIDALVDVIKKGLERFDTDAVSVLFSAHGLPVRFIKEGDPYVSHIMGTIKAVTEKVDIEWHLGYQSRTGPVRWLEPSTDEVIKRLQEKGVKDILIVPISFVSDHIETLYEIDILYKGIGERLGVRVERTESLNTHPLFIRALEDIVLKRVRQLKWQEV
jgi:ferrochelatase